MKLSLAEIAARIDAELGAPSKLQTTEQVVRNKLRLAKRLAVDAMAGHVPCTPDSLYNLGKALEAACEKIESIKDDVETTETLQEELSEAKDDTERLDFLQAQLVKCSTGSNFILNAAGLHVQLTRTSDESGDDLRDTIDRAQSLTSVAQMEISAEDLCDLEARRQFK